MRSEYIPSLDPTTVKDPLYARIASGIREDILRGRLAPGARLPGSRRLAERLGVHRNTVLAALGELTAEGWLETSPRSRVTVATTLPVRPPRPFAEPRAAMPTQMGVDLPEPAVPELADDSGLPAGCLSLAGGMPDVRLLPISELARAYRRALGRRGRSPVDYGDPSGAPALRGALAAMLTEKRGLTVGPEDLLVTRGSQMALYLLGRVLIRPGDVVAVERLGYRPAWEALRLAGARLVPIGVDAGGLCVAELAELCAHTPIRAVYLTPHHQYPTGAVLSPARRLRLLALERERRFVVLEDDYDNEFHDTGRPVLPLASVDRCGSVVYIGTLSKAFAPGVRVGFIVAPAELLKRACAYRRVVDRQGDLAVESAVAELLVDGEIQRHIRKMHRIYAARRAHLLHELETTFGERVAVTPPPGGMALWARVVPQIDVEAWSSEGLRQGVFFAPGRSFDFHRAPTPCIRLGFAARTIEELTEGVRRMASALNAQA